MFKDNLAKKLYEKFGFRVYEEKEEHFKMEKITLKGDICWKNYLMSLQGMVIM